MNRQVSRCFHRYQDCASGFRWIRLVLNKGYERCVVNPICVSFHWNLSGNACCTCACFSVMLEDWMLVVLDFSNRGLRLWLDLTMAIANREGPQLATNCSTVRSLASGPKVASKVLLQIELGLLWIGRPAVALCCWQWNQLFHDALATQDN